MGIEGWLALFVPWIVLILLALNYWLIPSRNDENDRLATMAVGKAGGRNAGLLAIQILALGKPDLHEKLLDYKKEMARQVEKAAKELDKG